MGLPAHAAPSETNCAMKQLRRRTEMQSRGADPHSFIRRALQHRLGLGFGWCCVDPGVGLNDPRVPIVELIELEGNGHQAHLPCNERGRVCEKPQRTRDPQPTKPAKSHAGEMEEPNEGRAEGSRARKGNRADGADGRTGTARPPPRAALNAAPRQPRMRQRPWAVGQRTRMRLPRPPSPPLPVSPPVGASLTFLSRSISTLLLPPVSRLRRFSSARRSMTRSSLSRRVSGSEPSAAAPPGDVSSPSPAAD